MGFSAPVIASARAAARLRDPRGRGRGLLGGSRRAGWRAAAEGWTPLTPDAPSHCVSFNDKGRFWANCFLCRKDFDDLPPCISRLEARQSFWTGTWVNGAQRRPKPRTCFPPQPAGQSTMSEVHAGRAHGPGGVLALAFRAGRAGEGPCRCLGVEPRRPESPPLPWGLPWAQGKAARFAETSA